MWRTPPCCISYPAHLLRKNERKSEMSSTGMLRTELSLDSLLFVAVNVRFYSMFAARQIKSNAIKQNGRETRLHDIGTWNWDETTRHIICVNGNAAWSNLCVYIVRCVEEGSSPNSSAAPGHHGMPATAAKMTADNAISFALHTTQRRKLMKLQFWVSCICAGISLPRRIRATIAIESSVLHPKIESNDDRLCSVHFWRMKWRVCGVFVYWRDCAGESTLFWFIAFFRLLSVESKLMSKSEVERNA